ncbi:hypothetical protein BT69DRAFT_1279968 [Atractiella rhizophila]|nr:hypothetical protein BT69DRAFT_1279962 [Atractiella rhizophila]KAH8925117.1 hypothetical protein BT69DRAFT_1279968 [Atractiella rhizophila]
MDTEVASLKNRLSKLEVSSGAQANEIKDLRQEIAELRKALLANNELMSKHLNGDGGIVSSKAHHPVCIFDIALVENSVTSTTMKVVIKPFDAGAPKVAAHFRELVSQKRYVGARLNSAAISKHALVCHFPTEAHSKWANEKILQAPEVYDPSRKRGLVFFQIARDGDRISNNAFFISDGETSDSETAEEFAYVAIGEIVSGIKITDALRRWKTSKFIVTDCNVC